MGLGYYFLEFYVDNLWITLFCGLENYAYVCGMGKLEQKLKELLGDKFEITMNSQGQAIVEERSDKPFCFETAVLHEDQDGDIVLTLNLDEISRLYENFQTLTYDQMIRFELGLGKKITDYVNKFFDLK